MSSTETTSMPERYDRARLRTLNTPSIDHEAISALMSWLFENRGQMEAVMPTDDLKRFYWHRSGVDLHWPHAHLLTQVLHENAELVAKAWKLDNHGWELPNYHARLFHHDSYEQWNYPNPEAWLGFRLYATRTPQRNMGGLVEWADGTTYQPVSGQLLLFDPRQAQRIQPVDCWSPHVMDGLWSIEGFVYPPGHDDRDQVGDSPGTPRTQDA